MRRNRRGHFARLICARQGDALKLRPHRLRRGAHRQGHLLRAAIQQYRVFRFPNRHAHFADDRLPPVVAVHIVLAHEVREEKFKIARRTVHQVAKRFHAVFANETVRIMRRRHCHYAHRQLGLEQ